VTHSNPGKFSNTPLIISVSRDCATIVASRYTPDAVRDMNSAYSETRFKVEAPASGFPARFGIITACNLDGSEQSESENERATDELRLELASGHHPSFPLTGGSSAFVHSEPGFGVAFNTRAEAIAVGCRWRQGAIFWVEGGAIELAPCDGGVVDPLGSWTVRLAPSPCSLSKGLSPQAPVDGLPGAIVHPLNDVPEN